MKAIVFFTALVSTLAANADTQAIICATTDTKAQPYFSYKFTFDGGDGPAFDKPELSVEATYLSFYGAELAVHGAIAGCEKAAVTVKDDVYSFSCGAKAATGALKIISNYGVARGSITFPAGAKFAADIKFPAKPVDLTCRFTTSKDAP